MKSFKDTHVYLLILITISVGILAIIVLNKSKSHYCVQYKTTVGCAITRYNRTDTIKRFEIQINEHVDLNVVEALGTFKYETKDWGDVYMYTECN